ncbi:MAG TPA: transporter substrate-binding domain-containing protein [Verrucomicrobiae bacterium]|jgi:polar amino acid transport system substrate-binding protein|nr:transporter substrate-binding domain-containing protein [Verrucomicrobiae bacterium]
MRRALFSVATLAAVLLAGCAGGSATSAPTASPTAAASSTAASVAPSVAPATPSPTANACAGIATVASGKITIGADNPAYPPYFQPDPSTPANAKWGLGDPLNGQGFEAAVADAVAQAMGFTTDQVVWAPVAFNSAIAPGAKPFDIYLTQVSYSADRTKAVDLTDGYFDLSQAVVALKANPIAQVTTVAGLKDFKLGAPVGTTSYTYITANIQPTKAANVYNDLDGAVKALQAKQIDGIVVDLPTAFYMRDAQLTGGTIVGYLPTVGDVEHFSILLGKGSPITACANQALASIKADGTLAALTQKWIYDQGAPALK